MPESDFEPLRLLVRSLRGQAVLEPLLAAARRKSAIFCGIVSWASLSALADSDTNPCVILRRSPMIRSSASLVTSSSTPMARLTISSRWMYSLPLSSADLRIA